MKVKALVDIEIIIHRVLSASEGSPVEAQGAECIRKAWEWRGLAGNADMLLCFSCPNGGNFRKVIDPTYKAHRSSKPENYHEVVKYIKDRANCMQINGLEADDLIGILQTSQVYGATKIISVDKDFLTIAGWLINPNDILRYQKPITEEEADINHLRQSVIGDTADNFKGIPGCGPKAAEGVFCWDDVVALGEKKGLPLDYLILQARLARILRREDYDRETNTIKLWHPTEPEAFDLTKMEVV